MPAKASAGATSRQVPRRPTPPKDAATSAASIRVRSSFSNLLLASTLVVATALAYSNAFSAPFVLDDVGVITDNETIRSLTPLSRVFSGPIQSSTAGRPLINFSFALNYAIDGVQPRGYHAVNLALHILCGLVLFGVIRRTVATVTSRADLPSLAAISDLSDFFAFGCVLIWLLHPLQTEVVDYVTQRTETSMALAYFTTLYAFIRGETADRRRWWHGLAIASCSLGMLCKESMVTAPLMVLLYDVVFYAGTFREAFRRRGGFYAGLAASWVVLALVAGGARSHSAGFSSGVSPWTYLLNQAPILVRYLTLTVWPHALVFDYGLPRAVALGSVVPAGLFIVSLLVAAAVLWRINRCAAFLATWFFVTLAPTSSFVPIATEVGAERRMYLPLVAIVVLLVFALVKILQDRRYVATAVAAASLVLAVVTFHRNSEYYDQTALWQQVLDRYPHSRAHYNYGVQLKEAGRRDEAIREYQIAAPDLADAEYALGFELLNDRRYDEAAVRFRRYLERNPLDIHAIRASNLLGRALLASGHPDEALVHYRETLRMQPGNADARSGIGEALLKLEKFEEAAAAFRGSLQVSSDNPSVYFDLGLALMNLSRFDEAVAALANAARLDPRNPAAHANLATSLAQLGRFDEAIAEFRQAASAESDPAARDEIRGMIEQLEREKKGAGQR